MRREKDAYAVSTPKTHSRRTTNKNLTGRHAKKSIKTITEYTSNRINAELSRVRETHLIVVVF